MWQTARCTDDLQALVQYYEDLLANGKITRPGWTSAKVSWALELDETAN